MATFPADERSTPEAFDGTNPVAYKRWKRRAQLTLAALPTTVPKEKWGPRLLHYIKGFAELVCETLPVEKLCEEKGEQLIFELLDDKYRPQPQDLLHKALKEFFYELQVKPSEPYQQFLARFYHASRRLVELDIKLPETVLGSGVHDHQEASPGAEPGGHAPHRLRREHGDEEADRRHQVDLS